MRGALVDAYGTLLTAPRLEAAAVDATTRWGVPPTTVGRAYRRLHRESSPERGGPFLTHLERFSHLADCLCIEFGYRRASDEVAHALLASFSAARPRPGAESLLRGLGRDYVVAIVSNADELPLRTALGELAHLVQLVVTSESRRAYKPDPMLAEHALRQLGVGPEDTVSIGDDHVDDCQPALGLGCMAICLDSFGPGRQTRHVAAVDLDTAGRMADEFARGILDDRS